MTRYVLNAFERAWGEGGGGSPGETPPHGDPPPPHPTTWAGSERVKRWVSRGWSTFHSSGGTDVDNDRFPSVTFFSRCGTSGSEEPPPPPVCHDVCSNHTRVLSVNIVTCGPFFKICFLSILHTNLFWMSRYAKRRILFFYIIKIKDFSWNETKSVVLDYF